MTFTTDMKGCLALIVLAGCCCWLTGCHSKTQTKVTIRVRSGHGQKIYLQRIPVGKEERQLLDSTIVEDMTRDIVFVVPRQEQRLYQLSFAGSGVKFLFINDAPELSLSGNFITGKYEVRGSVASAEIKQFLDQQKELAGRTRVLALRIKNAGEEEEAGGGTKAGAGKKPGEALSPAAVDSLKRLLDSSLAGFWKRYRSFADTVKSPAAFLLVYNNIEFGKDYDGESAFITAAAARFPADTSIRELRDEVLAYIKVMKEEFQVGDPLPPIVLPDRGGREFSTATLKGRYYFIDFYSTWCPQCLVYNRAKKELRKLFPASQLEMVSVAIDVERQDWENNLRQLQPDWPQLIDTLMWQGVAVRALKFDSIPFNFLVDPQGRILQKAIAPDSLTGVVMRALGRGQITR